MIILAIGAFTTLGLVNTGLFDQRKRIQSYNSDYAKTIQAKNSAHTAIQLAMEQINDDPSWAPTSGNPWTQEVDGAYIELYYDVLAVGSTVNDPDSIRIYSTSWYGGTGILGSSDYKSASESHSIVSTYLKSGLHFVPEAVGGLGLASGNFTFNMGGVLQSMAMMQVALVTIFQLLQYQLLLIPLKLQTMLIFQIYRVLRERLP